MDSTLYVLETVVLTTEPPGTSLIAFNEKMSSIKNEKFYMGVRFLKGLTAVPKEVAPAVTRLPMSLVSDSMICKRTVFLMPN